MCLRLDEGFNSSRSCVEMAASPVNQTCHRRYYRYSTQFGRILWRSPEVEIFALLLCTNIAYPQSRSRWSYILGKEMKSTCMLAYAPITWLIEYADLYSPLIFLKKSRTPV